MPGYVEGSLMRGERVIYEGKVSWWSMLPHIVLGILLLYAGVGLIFFIYAFIVYWTTELAFTNKRVIAKVGFIKRSAIELNIDRVESVMIDQGILGRVFNFGSLIVSGAGNPMAPIPRISNPMEFKRQLMCFIDNKSSAT